MFPCRRCFGETEAAATLLEATLFRHEEKFIKYGIKLEFGDDIICKTAKEWIDTPLKINYDDKNNTAKIYSPVLLTEINVKPNRFAGMYYMKLLSNSQIIEWITHDSYI